MIKENLEFNEIRNGEKFSAVQLDWGKCKECTELGSKEKHFDLICGSDVMYILLIEKMNLIFLVTQKMQRNAL